MTMFWQEDDRRTDTRIPDEVQDILFEIRCRELPVDHAFDMARALLEALPWLAEIEELGIHNIYLAGSQNGWERPDPSLGQRLIPSRRTKLTIRAPREVIPRLLQELPGLELDIAGHRLVLGDGKTRLLSRQGTIFARQVALLPGEAEDEHAFLTRVVEELTQRGIRIRKALCGKTQQIAHPDGGIQTRSIMFADLRADESLQLQQRGLGQHRLLGCGIFLPHKGIDAVKEAGDD